MKSASNLMRNDTLIAHLHYFGAVPPESKFSKLLNGLGKDWLRGLDLNQRGFGLRPSLLRLALVYLGVATGIVPLVVIYIVGWIIISKAPEAEIKAEEPDSAKY